MRKLRAPQEAMSARSSGVLRPDSEIINLPGGTAFESSRVVSSVVSKDLRLRLFIPIRGDFKTSARSSSTRSCTSISASMPQSNAVSSSSAACASDTLAMMIRMQSACRARASTTWYGSYMKSLRSAGSDVALRAWVRKGLAP